ncbi:MAG: hypothetical protein JWM25_1290 [Thermoleophilia bacterium]|nr:hypothetical protein [Thermoleophilia bacterium]
MAIGASSAVTLRATAAPVTPRSAPAVATAEDPPSVAADALPEQIQDAQGRVFKLQTDPTTGHPQYRHAATQRDQAGSTLDLEIVIDLAPDGSFERTTTQHLRLAGGDSQREQVVAAYDAAGQQLWETVDSNNVEGTATTREHTVGTFAAGQLVHRETDIVQSQEQTDPETKEHTRVEARIHGTWHNDGKPITAETVPHVDRTEQQVYTTPGGGLNKDTDRVLTFTRHGAGPVGALDWDDAGSVVVRFQGRGEQYLERELRVPLSADGEPDMGAATTVRTDDHQSPLTKGLTQARVWGGLTSNLAWIAGVNFGKGKLLTAALGVSAAASAASLTGEAHALATQRNDGDWGRLAMGVYDTMLTTAAALLIASRRSGGAAAGRQALSGGQKLALTGLGATGVAIHANDLRANGATVGGASRANAALADVELGSELVVPASSRDGRLEPRFDAVAALAA